MSKTLVIKEFDTIICNESLAASKGLIYLEEKRFRELEQFIKESTSQSDRSDELDFIKIGYRRGIGDTITFNNYVGIVELPSGFQVEILPKISLSNDDNYANTKRIFIKMLSCLNDFEGRSLSPAMLNADKMNLFEIFINMYIQEARNLVKSGIKSAYIPTEDNLRFYKGKLDVSKQIRYNAAHQERFYIHFDEFQVNRSENKLIKSTLLKLLSITQNPTNAKEIRKLLYSFELVDPSVNNAEDFSKVSLTRDMKGYELLISWARVFLLNKSFTTFSGGKNGKALLFPMEQVFEAFVSKQIRRIFEANGNGAVRVSLQDKGYYLFDQPKQFRLRPDIVVRYTSNQSSPIIMDTKWKRLTNTPSSNYGISQADMYQMYAYAKKYNAHEIWLIYPLNEDINGLNRLTFEAIENANTIRVNVFFTNLSNHIESLHNLYELTCNKQFSLSTIAPFDLS